MPKKYRVHVKQIPEEFLHKYPPNFIIERNENCINCGMCIKSCVYGVHQRSKAKKMAEPLSSLCKGCLRCIQECPVEALSIRKNPELEKIGGSYWKPDTLLSIMKQADNGKIPVSGSGYRGPFTGKYFDSIWTDMSEIVRPTRDGIHGREYINTLVEIGRRADHLEFDEKNLKIDVPETISIPLPIMLDLSDYNIGNIGIYAAMAAEELNTFAIINTRDINLEVAKHASHIIPLFLHEDIKNELNKHLELIKKTRMIEIEYDEILHNKNFKIIEEITKKSGTKVIIRIPLTRDAIPKIIELAKKGVEAVHIVGDHRGKERKEIPDDQKGFISDIIMDLHHKLVENCVRDRITIIASGGIASAEHVPKLILCGADVTCVDIVLLIALGAKIYEDSKNLSIEMKLNAPKEILSQKIINLIGAWHLQLLEVMGAMGIREARRLRGEIERTIFFKDIDKEAFGEISKKP